MRQGLGIWKGNRRCTSAGAWWASVAEFSRVLVAEREREREMGF
jgi:hypothetical protein